ncbi:MAG TPA: PAS domain S-box protein [Candidatus Obscuribacterales bacterium]
MRVLLLAKFTKQNDALAERLKKRGVAVQQVQSVDDGLACISKRSADVVLLDLSLEGESMETWQKIQSHVTSVPVVIMSSHENKDLAIQIIQQGAQEYLIKSQPSIDSLIRCLRYAIERRRFEEQLHASDRISRLIVDNAPDAFVSINGNGEIIGWNPSAERIFGWSYSEVAGKKLVDLIIPAHLRERHMEGVRRFLANGNPKILNTRFEVPALNKSGKQISIELGVFSIEDSTPSFGAFINDVTERKKLEQRREASYEITRIIAESTSLKQAAPSILKILHGLTDWEFFTLFIVDKTEDVMKCLAQWHKPGKKYPAFSSASSAITFERGKGLPGRVWQDCRAHWIDDLAADNNFPRAAQAAEDGLHAGIAFPIVLNGEVWGIIEGFSADVLNCDADLLSFCNSLSTQLGQFMKRTMLETELREYELLKQREDFVSMLTHDLKNPLVGADRILTLLVEGRLGEMPAKHKTILSQLKDSNSALLKRVDKIKDIYQIERDLKEAEFTVIDINNLVLDRIKEVLPKAQARGIKISCELPERAVKVCCHEDSIRRMVQHLLDNAVKYNKDGGQVTAKIISNENQLTIEVHDTGQGVADPEKRFLFERVWQGIVGSKYPSGTGLGLYLCSRIANGHHGRIYCKSEAGRGSQFVVNLPLWNDRCRKHRDANQ